MPRLRPQTSCRGPDHGSGGGRPVARTHQCCLAPSRASQIANANMPMSRFRHPRPNSSYRWADYSLALLPQSRRFHTCIDPRPLWIPRAPCPASRSATLTRTLLLTSRTKTATLANVERNVALNERCNNGSSRPYRTRGIGTVIIGQYIDYKYEIRLYHIV
jgi:hypothetical protein